jgi:hypothetical protein
LRGKKRLVGKIWKQIESTKLEDWVGKNGTGLREAGTKKGSITGESAYGIISFAKT